MISIWTFKFSILILDILDPWSPSDLPQPKPYRVGGYWAPLAFLDLTLDTSSSMTHSTPSPCLRHSGCWTAHMLLSLWLKVSSNLILSLHLLKPWSLFKVKPKYVSTSSPYFPVAVVSPFGVFPSLYIWFLWGSGQLTHYCGQHST